MQIKFLRTLGALLMAGSMLTGCHSDIDLGNVNTSTAVQMGLMVPIGKATATVGDFVGDMDNIYIDTVGVNTGGLVWRNNYRIERSFAKFDLSKYVTTPPPFSLNVYDNLAEKSAIPIPPGTDIPVQGKGKQDTLHFAIPIKLSGVNSADVAHRIDSAQINKARFTSLITRNNLPLDWKWIDSVQLILGDRVRRPKGNVMTVYTKEAPAVTDYNQHIDTDIDAFTINMMKNDQLRGKTDWQLYLQDNVVDSVTFYVDFLFTIPADTQVVVKSDAKFVYEITLAFINYKAMWGNFTPSDDMAASSEEDLSSAWGELEFLRTSKLPFAEPTVRAHINTELAGAMVISGDSLYTIDNDGKKHWAMFGNSTARQPETFFPGPWEKHALDPYKDSIGAVSDAIWIDFNNTDAGGNIDELFYNMPQRLHYKFNVDFKYDETPQIRVTSNDTILVDAECRLPLIFHQGVHVDYTDTITDVNLSEYSIDSLVASTNSIESVQTSDISLVLIATSTIQLPVKATMRCYNAKGEMLMDPDSAGMPLLLFPQDTILIAPPTFAYINGQSVPTAPGKTNIRAELTKKKLNMLPEIKSIIYNAIIDDESMAYIFKDNPNFCSKIRAEEKLTFEIGVTANVDAVFNFSK